MLAGCLVTVRIATAIVRDFTVPGAWDANTLLRTPRTRHLLNASLANGVQRYIQQSIPMAYPYSGEALDHPQYQTRPVDHLAKSGW